MEKHSLKIVLSNTKAICATIISIVALIAIIVITNGFKSCSKELTKVKLDTTQINISKNIKIAPEEELILAKIEAPFETTQSRVYKKWGVSKELGFRLTADVTYKFCINLDTFCIEIKNGLINVYFSPLELSKPLGYSNHYVEYIGAYRIFADECRKYANEYTKDGGALNKELLERGEEYKKIAVYNAKESAKKLVLKRIIPFFREKVDNILPPYVDEQHINIEFGLPQHIENNLDIN